MPAFTAPSRRTTLLLVAIMLVLGGGGLFAWFHLATRESTDDAQVDGHIISVAPRVPGTVTAVHVLDNQWVKAGDPLLKLDPRDYQLALERAQAELADAVAAAKEAAAAVPVATAASSSTLTGAEAGTARAAAGAESARVALGAAQARQASAEARLLQAQTAERKAAQDLARLEPLMRKEEIAQAQYDAAVAAAEAARASVAAARADVTESESGVAGARSKIAEAETALTSARAAAAAAATGPQQVAGIRAHASIAEARVQRAEVNVQQARLNLQYTTITAPRDGLTSRKTVEPGETVSAGQPLLAVIPLDDVWVTANFKETQLQHMRPGQVASISVDAYDGELTGRVDSIAAATGARFSLLPPENASGNFVKVVQRVPVKIVLDPNHNQALRLRPGMSATVTVFVR
jgi:membrane fusion protein, multidrug efflux system